MRWIKDDLRAYAMDIGKPCHLKDKPVSCGLVLWPWIAIFVRMWNKKLLVVLTVWIIGCQNNPSELETDRPSGDSRSLQVIAEAIEAHGGDQYENHDIEFDFRGRHYRSFRESGKFQYERIFTDSTGHEIRDVLTNESFVRYIDGTAVDLPEERKKAFSNSVNSVIYFALLPYYLSDPAVQSEYIGDATIQGEPYHKIEITFRQEGGGKDFEDEFLYWFHQHEHTLDYLAYNYQTDGGGSRFRKAINPRVIGGIRFSDYINYKPAEETLYIMNFDSLYQGGHLDSLSLIATENIMVK